MATGTYAPNVDARVVDSNGTPVSGGLVWTYLAGTTTTVSTYTDVNLSVANTNPIIAGSDGRYVAFLTPGVSYKFVEEAAATPPAHGAVIITRDNILSVPLSAANLDITGTAGEALTAGQVVYNSDGSGSKTAGSWYKADSANPYSSVTPTIGMVPISISSLASGTVRLAGSVGGLTVSIGTDYFIGTAGALTVTAPALARFVGRADTSSSLILKEPKQAPPTNSGVAQGRLTLTTATAVTTADVTAATMLYYTPYNGNGIALYDGSAYWNIRTFSELSIAVPATTSQMYDVWVYDNSGTAALELLAWTNDTSRATALALQNGVPVKTGATTRRLVGCFRTTAVSGQTEDSAAKRYVWNCNNRVRTFGRVVEATDNWTYSTATYRQANTAPGNQIDLVVGLAESVVDVTLQAFASNDAGNSAYISIGYDSTTTPTVGVIGEGGNFQAANQIMPLTARLTHYPAVGRHTYVWLEKAAGGATSWRGDNADSTLTQSGIHAVFEK